MNSSKFKFIYELIFTLTIIPTMIGAIIKSIQLIPLHYTNMAASMSMSSQALITLIVVVMQINMLLAIMSIIILIVNLGLIRQAEKNPNITPIGSWASWTIKLCALSNMFVAWFLDKYNAVETDLKPALLLWTITFGLSVLSSLLSKLTKK